MKKTTLLIFAGMLLLSMISNAQVYVFKGQVRAKDVAIAVPNATILLADSIRTVTDAEGWFTISITGKPELPIEITSIGYKPLAATMIASKGGSVFYLEKQTVLMEPVEIRAVRAGEKSPFTKSTISKNELSKYNLGQDIPFLLNQTPSVVVNSDAGNGVGYTGIRIRGTDATRINVTLNGIPYNDAESQGLFFVNLPDFSSSVNSIQVQRGVGTSSNGTGAFGATINMTTNEVNEKPYAELNNSFGSFNTWKNTFKAGTGLLNNHFTIDSRLSRISSDGYIDRARTDMYAWYLSGAYLNENSSLRINAFSGNEKTYQAWNGVPEELLKTNRRFNPSGTEKPGTPYDNETDNYKQDHYQAFFNHKFNSKLALNLALFYTRGKGYYEQYKAEVDYADYGLPDPAIGGGTISTTDIIRQLWLDNHFYGNTFSLQYRNDKTEIILGGGVSKYDGDHYGKIIWASNGGVEKDYRWYNLDAFKTDYNVYGKWQQQLGRNFYLFGDLQYRHVNYELNGFRNSPNIKVNTTWNFVNPKAGLSYVNKEWTAYLSYALANKEPNRDDFEAGIEQQPKHETLHDFELGIEKRNAVTSFGLTGYYMRYKDQLVLTGQINDVGAYTRTNIPESYRLGIELQGRWKPVKWFTASANLALSENKVLNFTEYYDDYDAGGQKSVAYEKTDISFSPAVVGGAQLQFNPARGLELGVIGKYVGRQYLDNTSNKSRSLNPYFLTDIRVQYIVPQKWMKEIGLLLQLNNIFNKLYEPNGYTYSYQYNGELVTSNNYFPMAGFNVMAGVNLRF
jgi:iron complex outermembrane receptor protein